MGKYFHYLQKVLREIKFRDFERNLLFADLKIRVERKSTSFQSHTDDYILFLNAWIRMVWGLLGSFI